MSKISEWIRNIGKWIEGVLKGNQREPVPVRIPVKR
ncbi:hypothetical protein TFLX_03422 [Thermoflexales bacterium]|nr:hypothetical protein TFLX_03422 [Thermoflexales bacterium]